jgi:LPXTG-motif cell wall-anchored protein
LSLIAIIGVTTALGSALYLVRRKCKAV